MTTNTEWTLTENIEAWLSILPRCRAWNARAHAARETWNLTLRGPVVEWVSVKLNDLRRPQVLEQVRAALGAASVSYVPQEYVASGRGAFGRLKGGNRSCTNAASLRITY